LPAAAIIRHAATCNDDWLVGLSRGWAGPGRAVGGGGGRRDGPAQRAREKAGIRAGDLGNQPVQPPPGAIP